MKILLSILIVLIIYLVSTRKPVEKFVSARNKCFACEKDIKSVVTKYQAFPSKCFDCEKQFIADKLDDGKNYDKCNYIDTSDSMFETYWRNRFPNRA